MSGVEKRLVSVTAKIVLRGGEMVIRLDVDGKVLHVPAPDALYMGDVLHRLAAQVEGMAMAICGMSDIGLSNRTLLRAADAMLDLSQHRDPAPDATSATEPPENE